MLTILNHNLQKTKLITEKSKNKNTNKNSGQFKVIPQNTLTFSKKTNKFENLSIVSFLFAAK